MIKKLFLISMIILASTSIASAQSKKSLSDYFDEEYKKKALIIDSTPKMTDEQRNLEKSQLKERLDFEKKMLEQKTKMTDNHIRQTNSLRARLKEAFIEKDRRTGKFLPPESESNIKVTTPKHQSSPDYDIPEEFR